MMAPFRSERGFALVTSVLVLMILFVLAMALLFEGHTEHLVAANETDHRAALGYAEAGLTWAERRFWDAPKITGLLRGPDATASTADDGLFGMRNLTLTSTAQFTSANENTASAIVTRDFAGLGSKSWEVLRVPAEGNSHALVYVRLDDNYDDDDDDPTNNDPLTDKDWTVRATVVAEYPVFHDVSGVEQTAPADRGRARRMLSATFSQAGLAFGAITTNGDLDFYSSAEACGDCGSLHANGNLDVNGANVCQDATAAGSITGSTANVGGDSGGGYEVVELPVINPYDDVYVPSLDTFDTSSDTALPLGLRCPKATAADPGASKYFALIPNAADGEVWKAYWDFTNDRWTWTMIDDLGDNTNVQLDDCGRAPGDPQYGSGAAGAVNDTDKKSFYGFGGDKLTIGVCALCSGAGADKSLCGVADNDFNATGHYPPGGGGLVAWPPLPGNYQPDGTPDFDATSIVTSVWSNNESDSFSPVYGAVFWILGGAKLNGSMGASSPADFNCSAGAGCVNTVMPHGSLRISLIGTGDLELGGSANFAPANVDVGYHFLMVSGRDLSISGNAQVDTPACNGGCPSGGPADLPQIGGIYAAHEQSGFSGTPNLYGFVLAEDAIDCSKTEGPDTKISGTPEIYYDCQHPPNPWAMGGSRMPILWHEVE